ncbi:DUF3631 domain-containing protein [Longispora albida]|uniref:DUF3631 domain-containing protein n=1 Tax=Longispora albida TaxID=203523 RepID=UPI0003A72CDB|nr:DUF3631 domain-containing protein [Longispora albida]
MLWILHTYGFEVWDSTPRIAFMAPEKDSGKSRALELIEALCQNGQIIGGKYGISLAGMRQFINGPLTPTLLVDEVDTVFGQGRSNEDLRGFINSGYRRKTGVVVRAGKADEGPTFYSTFAPVAMAGISARALPETIVSRSLVVRMRRAQPWENVEDFDDADPAECAVLAARLRDWMRDLVARGRLGGAVPVPAEVRNRARQIWKPLIAIAAAAGPVWLARAQAACLFFVADAKARDTPALGTQILALVRDMFIETEAAGGRDADFLPTDKIVERIAAEYTITQTVSHKRLGLELAEYEVKPVQRRYQGGGAKRGYQRCDFLKAWQYYLPPLPEETASPAFEVPVVAAAVAAVAGLPRPRAEFVSPVRVDARGAQPAVPADPEAGARAAVLDALRSCPPLDGEAGRVVFTLAGLAGDCGLPVERIADVLAGLARRRAVRGLELLPSSGGGSVPLKWLKEAPAGQRFSIVVK